MVKKFIIGNWKMHGLQDDARDLVQALKQKPCPEHVQVAVCPPVTLLISVAAWLRDSEIALGAQDCHAQPKGAFTGDISAPMLRDAGCGYVILGHSERRAAHGETSEMVRNKAEAALLSGLTPVICLGETLQQRQQGRTLAVLKDQLMESLPKDAGEQVIVAYEPVWAIGTGQVASLEEIDEVHQALLGLLRNERGLELGRLSVLYGGSVKPDNARSILMLDSVGGVLVGGASLVAEDFLNIIASA